MDNRLILAPGPHLSPLSRTTSKMEDILKIREILCAYSGKGERDEFLRDALLIFRVNTFGWIGALTCCAFSALCTFFIVPFHLCALSSLVGFALGGSLCAYASGRITLLVWKKYSTVMTGRIIRYPSR
jgi:hypothetical protein